MKPTQEISAHRPVAHGGIHSVSNPKSGTLDFSSNLSPAGPPPAIAKYLKSNLDSVEAYPDSDSDVLRKNLQAYTKIPASHIVVGNGATEIIYNFCRAFLSKKTLVLIPAPTFGEYEAAARLCGATVKLFDTMNLQDDMQEFCKAIPRHGCLFLCNPNNPTGKLYKKDMIKRIVNVAAKRSCMVFVDECFIELTPERNESVSKMVPYCKNLLVLRSLTKSFSLAGIRIGYALGDKKIIQVLQRIKIPWNVSGLAQGAAVTALRNTGHLKKANKVIKTESRFLQKEISKIDGFECYDSDTNFILIKTRLESKTIQNRLLQKKILIRDCSSFRGLNANHIRIAIKDRASNMRLIRAMRNIS